MNAFLEPQRVEKPYLMRWLRCTVGLILRSPVRFGVVSAVARGADDARMTRIALTALGRGRIWANCLVAGAGVAALSWLAAWLAGGIGGGAPKDGSYMQHPGALVDSLGMGVVLIVVFLGLCYFPLVAFAPNLSAREARRLSHRASAINEPLVVLLFIGTLALCAYVLSLILPLWGMTMAVCIVFIGVVNYVAYRDIFERRSQNLPKAVAPARAAVRDAEYGRRPSAAP